MLAPMTRLVAVFAARIAAATGWHDSRPRTRYDRPRTGIWTLLLAGLWIGRDGFAHAGFVPAGGGAGVDVYQPQVAHDVDLLPNGNLLVTDGGAPPDRTSGGIYEIDRQGHVLWSYTSGLSFAHNADRMTGGRAIVSDTGNDRVIIVRADGVVVWNSDTITLSDGSRLRYPNDANVLPSENLLITDRDNHRVIEIAPDGTIVWQFGHTGLPGAGPSRLNGPHNADRLANGNTIICDSNNDRIIEVNSLGAIAWTYASGLDWPRDADRLLGGNSLVNDSNNHRILEVAPDGATVWEFPVPFLSYDSDRLPNGNTLISCGNRILEVDPTGTLVWSYPQSTSEEVVWVTNPASGIDLYCHVHRPEGFDPGASYPGVVLVPGGSNDGSGADVAHRAQTYANLGFIVMHFDPDGRGQSTGGGSYTEEDYNGFLQQDGLRVVLEYLVDLPETDDTNIGVLSLSYGITMAAGALARYAHDPGVKFLIDWEGPANRDDTARPHGHVDHDPTDDEWWQEREASGFISQFRGYYLRVQSEADHVQPDNDHAILLVNLATHTRHGGSGQSIWTRVNSGSGVAANEPNAVYTAAQPPEWIPEGEDTEPLLEEYLVELAAMPPVAGPVRVVFDLHMDPMHAIPPARRSGVYRDWRDAANWVLDVCEPRGAKVTFLAVGEFYEYILEDPVDGYALLRRLYRSGDSLGTHSHNERQAGPHDWVPVPGDSPLPVVVAAWDDHVGLADAAVAGALGLSDPGAIRAVNNIRGTHLPNDDALRLQLMEDYGFTMHQQGPDEQFYAYFQHYPMNPYRPSRDNMLAHDRDGPVVLSPFGPVLGLETVHFGIHQDMRLAAVKARFLLELLNWLHDVHVAQSGRVWVTGWGSHGSDVVPGTETHAAVQPILDWLKEHFVDKHVGGYQAASFSSAAECRDLYEAWESAHPAEASFTYPASTTDWTLYPYLTPAARYLAGAQYVDPMPPVGPVRWHALEATTGGDPYDMYVAYTTGAAAATVDLSAVLGGIQIAVVDPATGDAAEVSAAEVEVVPTGVLLVPPDRVLRDPPQPRFRRGDANGDETFDISDAIATLAVLFLGQGEIVCDDAADANDDGTVDISDAVFSLVHLFLGKNDIPPPGPASCGDDGTADGLGCKSYPACV